MTQWAEETTDFIGKILKIYENYRKLLHGPGDQRPQVAGVKSSFGSRFLRNRLDQWVQTRMVSNGCVFRTMSQCPRFGSGLRCWMAADGAATHGAQNGESEQPIVIEDQ